MPRSALREAWLLIETAVNRFSEHRLIDWAAALTYYSMLSIFPALVVAVSALGVAGESATRSLIGNFEQLTPGPVRDLFIGAIANIQASGTTAGIVLAVSLALSLYSASSYIGAFIRAADIVWDCEGRRFYHVIPLRIGITLLLLLLLLAIGGVVIATGPLADDLRKLLGLGADSIVGNGTLRWPLLVALITLVVSTLYNLAPNVEDRRFRPLTAGSALAISLWLAGSVVFTAYIANFGSYNMTFGSLAGVAIFLIWLWLSNMALLLGVELDAELRRYRKVHGRPAFSRRR